MKGSVVSSVMGCKKSFELLNILEEYLFAVQLKTIVVKLIIIR